MPIWAKTEYFLKQSKSENLYKKQWTHVQIYESQSKLFIYFYIYNLRNLAIISTCVNRVYTTITNVWVGEITLK